MAQGRRNAQLHGHAPGVLLEFLPLRQLQPRQPLLIDGLIPAPEGPGHDPAQLSGRENLGHKGLVQHHAHILLAPEKFRAPVVHTQHGHRAAVPLQGVHDEPDGGALAGPVLPHQTQYAPVGQVQVQILQGKVLVPLGQAPDLNGV